jgi:hypothetical protein
MKSNLRDIYVNATPIILYIKFNQYTTTNHHTKININPIVWRFNLNETDSIKDLFDYALILSIDRILSNNHRAMELAQRWYTDLHL